MKAGRLDLEHNLNSAAARIRSGDAVGAVHGAMSVLTAYCEQQESSHVLPLVDRLVSSWPNRGIRIAYDRGLAITYDTQAFDIETARIYVAVVSRCISESIAAASDRRHVADTFWQTALNATRDLSTLTPRNWSKLRTVLSSARLYCLQHTRDGRRWYEDALEGVCKAFDLDRETAHYHVRDFVGYQAFLSAQKRAATNQKVGRAIRANFVWENERDYAELTRRDTRSRLLTTLHFGNFGHAGLRVGSHTPAGRCIIALRNGELGQSDFATKRHYEQRGIQYDIVNSGERTPLQLLAALRKGNVTLGTLFDLHGKFGGTVPVTFFGRTAHFAKGPVELAVIAKIPIVAYVTYQEKGNDYITMQEILDTKLGPREHLHDAVQRLTQNLVSLSEPWIRRYPDQWQYMTQISSYFKSFEPAS